MIRMILSSLRFRQIAILLALVVTGMLIGNFVGSGGRWQAQVAPPAVCGNSRCELGERRTLRIPSLPIFRTENDGEVIIGHAVSYAGDTDGNGAGDLLVVGTEADYGSYDSAARKKVWLVRMEQDGRMKSYSQIAGPEWGYQYAEGGFAAGVTLVQNPQGTPVYAVSSNENSYPNYTAIRFYDQSGGAMGTSGDGITNLPHHVLAGIGDIDGNGIGDLAVANQYADTPYGMGKITVVLLEANYSVKSTHVIASEGDGFGTDDLAMGGRSITALGDLDGDGLKEIAVGNGNTGGGEMGSVYILSLRADGSVADKRLLTPGSDFTLQGELNGFANSLAGVGDWNGDGVPDLAVLSYEYVEHPPLVGSHASPVIHILLLTAQKGVAGTQSFRYADLGAFAGAAVFGNGWPLAAMPDQDGDGKMELILGVPGDGSCGGQISNPQGAVHVILSRAMTACPGDCNFCPQLSYTPARSSRYFFTPGYSTLPPLASCGNSQCNAGEMNPVVLQGADANQPYVALSLFMGTKSLDTLGDFDGDGVDDLVLGGVTQNVAGVDRYGMNEVQIVRLNSNGTQKSVTRIYEGTSGLQTGDADGSYIGAIVASIGDLDADGVRDIAVSAFPQSRTPTSYAVWILLLRSDGTVKSARKIAAGQGGFTGSIAEKFGTALEGIGDFDGDGVPDLAVGDPGYSTYNTAKEGRVHLLMLNRNGTVKSSRTLWASSFTAVPNTSDMLRASHPYIRFGSAVAFLGDVHSDGRKFLAVGGGESVWTMAFNVDGSLNTVKRTQGTAVSPAGDQDGDGKTDLIISYSPDEPAEICPECEPTYDTAWAAYYSVLTDGTLEQLWNASYGSLYLPGGGGTWWGNLPGREVATIRDLDGDQKHEFIMLDSGSFTCRGSSHVGLAWLLFSGSLGPRCEADCASVNFCAVQQQAPVCGNGTAESGEQCGEPGLSCSTGQTCQNCLCVGGTSSSQQSLDGTWVNCPAGWACNKSLDSGVCNTRSLNPPPPGCTTEMGTTCGTAACSGTCSRMVCASSSSSSAVSVSVSCGNGIKDGSEQCESPAMRQTMTTGPRPGWVRHGDFNADGWQDLVTVNYSSDNANNSISVFLNRGDGTFFTKVDYPFTPQHQVLSIDVYDMNDDGKVDFIVRSGGKLRVLKGNGDGTFQSPASFLPGDPFTTGIGAAFGDFNEDGRTDVVTGITLSSGVQFFAGQGGGAFAAGVTAAGYPSHLHIVTADFDADGHTDVAFLPTNSGNDPSDATFEGSVQVLYGNGAGAFTAVPIPQPSSSVSNMMGFFVRDANLDGRPDLIVRGNGSVSTIWINNGNRTFQEKTTNGGPMGESRAFFDIDGDGKMDVITSAYSTGMGKQLEVHKGVGDGSFQNTASYVIPLPHSYTCLMTAIIGADFNRDGKLDMAVAHGNACQDNITNADAVSVFLSPCAPGQTCANCQCSGGVPVSSSSSSLPVVVSSSSHSSSASIIVGSSSSIAVASFCPNGVIEPAEQCEIGYACPTGSTCNSFCVCSGGASSSSSIVSSFPSSSLSSIPSSVSSAQSSVSIEVFCGNAVLEGTETCEANHPCPTGQLCMNCLCSTPSYCGDNVVNTEDGEQCESDPDCSQGEVCTLNCLCHAGTGGNCGNGTMEALEQCERNHPCGEGMQCQACLCVEVPRCGNNVRERGEQCETNVFCPVGSSCVNCLCQQGMDCGDGNLAAGEQCEKDSHCLEGQFCNMLACQCEGAGAGCGDGMLEGSEQCELGSPCQNFEESCDLSTCRCTTDPIISTCGNAMVDAGEDCDIGMPCGEGEICNFANCHCMSWATRCGDAQLSENEQCEIGLPCADLAQACDLSRCVCAALEPDASCGDGLVAVGEECEVGVPCPFGWSCNYSRCQCLNLPICGDGSQDAGEQCEVTLACSESGMMCDFSRCRCVGNLVACGNGVLDPGEQCDDGDTSAGDGCDARCQREWITMVGGTSICGNGIVELPEECDDSNVLSGDGCSGDCRLEIGGVIPNLDTPGLSISPEHAAGPTIQAGQMAQGGQIQPGGSAASSGVPSQGAGTGPETIVFPGQQGVISPFAQQSPAYYGSVIPPFAPVSGPVGSTGPAAVAVIAAGAASGWAWMRRRRR